MELKPITRQEKIIAGQDLTPITRMEKFLKQFGGGGGGLPTGGAPYQQFVTDGEGNAKWEDRLAYSEGFCITWSGDSAGFNEAEVPFYKVTDRVFTSAELVGSTYIIHNNGVEEEYVITADNIVENNGALLVSLSGKPRVASVSEPFSFFESPGTYFSMTSKYVYSSCIKKGEIAPVGMHFLPLNYRIKFTLTPGDVITGTCNATYYQLLNYVCNGDPIHATVFYQNGDKIVSAPVVSIVDKGVASIEFNFTDSDGLIGASTIYYNLVDGISVT